MSCASTATPYSIGGEGSYDQPLPESPAAVRTEAAALMQRGDLARADDLLVKALDENFPDPWPDTFRYMRQEIRKAIFFRKCPLRLEAESPGEVFVLGDKVPVSYTIANLSEDTLRIPSRGSWSWLPFTESRQSFIQGLIKVTDVAERGNVVTGGSWTEFISLDGTVDLPQDSERTWELELQLDNSPSVIYRRLEIQGRLYAGGLEVGDHDFGMLQIPFVSRTVHFFKADRMEGIDFGKPSGFTLDDLAAEISAGDGSRLFQAAVLLPETERWEAVDAIVKALRELEPAARRMAIAALTVLTGKNEGQDHSDWIDWWEEAGPGLLKVQIAQPLPALPVAAAASGVPVRLMLALSAPDSGTGRGSVRRKAVTTAREAGNGNGEQHFDAWRSRLSDPYHGRRYAARKSIAEQGQAVLPLLDRLLRDQDARVRRGAAAALAEIGGEDARDLLSSALARETERSVQQDVIRHLARSDCPLPERFGQDDERGCILRRRIYMDNRLMVTLESILHEGGVPGFYDGQFAGIWEISPDPTDSIRRIVTHDDYHYVLRVLAIMSLSEKDLSDLEALLRPLVVPAASELSREWYVYFDQRRWESLPIGFWDEVRALNLSGYARYSMAKSGIDKFVKAKIAEMRKWISRRTAMIDEKGMFEGFSWRIDVEREFSLGLYFDIGYEYQQKDDYEKAELWYLRLINNFPDANAVGNAHYNLACLYSIRSEVDKALHHLDLCVAKGFLDFAWMEKDRDLDNARSHPGYERLKQKVFDNLADDEKENVDGGSYYGIHDLIWAFVEDRISREGNTEDADSKAVEDADDGAIEDADGRVIEGIENEEDIDKNVDEDVDCGEENGKGDTAKEGGR